MTEFDADSAPRTVGELRRRLEALGNPWQVDPALADDDPIPEYPRGGEETPDHPALLEARIAPETDLADELRRHPPGNPFLRERWAELGLMPADDAAPTEQAAPEREEDRG